LLNLKTAKAKGFNVPIDDLRYIKLAQYEDEEERKEKALVNYDPDEWYESTDTEPKQKAVKRI